MAFSLDRLTLARIVDTAGKPMQSFQRLWQKTVEKIEAQEATQDAIIARIRRVNSHTQPTTILTATEDGVDCTVAVEDHVRVYADGTTLSITGTGASPFTGLDAETAYAVYYDDTTLADTTPTFVITAEPSEAQAAVAEGRHFCGIIVTPELASGETIESGGAYAIGTSLYGEIQTAIP